MQFRKATNCACWFVHGLWTILPSGRWWKSQSWSVSLLHCIVEISCTSWNIFDPEGMISLTHCWLGIKLFLFAPLTWSTLRFSPQICELDIDSTHKNLLCKPHRRESWIGNSRCLLPLPWAYLFYASAVWFKKGQSLLAFYVKHISPILLACLISAAFYSAQHFLFRKKKKLYENAPVLFNMNGEALAHVYSRFTDCDMCQTGRCSDC